MEHVDVLIIGAGLSGIGAACHLRRACPDKTFTILEAREALGGTWDLFRYPGIRSDSDMFTFGYGFRPWTEAKSIADGPAILRYLQDTARERGVDGAIRYRHAVERASWSSSEMRWTVEARRTDTGETVALTCGFLFFCSGYYRYDRGYTPDFEGMERFAGRIVHPQQWPQDLDYAGKRVLVIGSGATAVTLVPAMAKTAAHVTMLQRSPTWMLALPARDAVGDALLGRLPERMVVPVMRWKNILLGMAVYRVSRRAPRLMKRLLRRHLERLVPAGYDIDKHLWPSYNPWDQRMCLVADGDLFAAVRRGDVTIVTDHVARFVEDGVELRSGAKLAADIIVTATGLDLVALGGVAVTVDGRPIEIAKTVGYKGMMLSGVPNAAMSLGYTNASWTLKSDLVAEYVCRLLQHMDRHGYRRCTPRAPDPSQRLEPFIDLDSGYVRRAHDRLPRQGSRPPWRLHQSYLRDLRLFRHGPIEDEGIEFTPAAGTRPRALRGRLSRAPGA